MMKTKIVNSTNREDVDSREVGDKFPLIFYESPIDAEDDGLEVFRANGTCSERRQEVTKSDAVRRGRYGRSTHDKNDVIG